MLIVFGLYTRGTIRTMANALSVITKQELAKDSKNALTWVDLDSRDRKIVMAVCFTDSIENARKSMKLSVGGFYKRWQYLKPIYESLLDDLPHMAVNIMKGYSVKAAEALGKNLEAERATDQIKAANSILDRVTPKQEETQHPRLKISFEEWLNADDPIQKLHG